MLTLLVVGLGVLSVCLVTTLHRSSFGANLPAALAGEGAVAQSVHAVQMHGQNTENAPVEETELNYPEAYSWTP